MAVWAIGISIALAFLVFSGATAAGAALLAWAALRQASTAADRHYEQTNADRQRRLTESFSKAVEQLGSDKLEVRLGGIYSLERISKESPDDYWTVMENLTAFIRERSRRNEAERTSESFEQRVSRCAYFLWHEAGRPEGKADDFWAEAIERDRFGEQPATDISAALTVIKRRSDGSRERERANAWHLDLSGAVLKGADLRGVHLEGVKFAGTHLEGADLQRAHLEGADFVAAHLEGAFLQSAYLEGTMLPWARLERAMLLSAQLQKAWLQYAHLERATFQAAHLEGAFLQLAHLEGTDLKDSHIEGANLSGAVGLTEGQLVEACGDASTQLSPGMARPPRWAASERAT